MFSFRIRYKRVKFGTFSVFSFSYEAEAPRFEDVVRTDALDAEVAASGVTKQMEKDLQAGFLKLLRHLHIIRILYREKSIKVWQYMQLLQNMVMSKNKDLNTLQYLPYYTHESVFGVKNMLLIMCMVPVQHRCLV